MRFTLATLTALISAAAATTVRYDPGYDVADNSLANVACSDGDYGLLTRGYSTYGSLPNFPHIGAMGGVYHASPQCGTCWQLSWTDEFGTTRSIAVTAIDQAGNGFNIAQTALDELTNGRSAEKGSVDASVTQLDASACGL
ncbi:Cerato-platanin [Schizophyllum amplum]|uniref:Cerato-platanin n=1 Tax=Schizophyllum amplum TaxID=97359 RepID=A0A550CSD9_9AGAR|nr:Cerato-platanin [Auriculariopsis ampla]